MTLEAIGRGSVCKGEGSCEEGPAPLHELAVLLTLAGDGSGEKLKRGGVREEGSTVYSGSLAISSPSSVIWRFLWYLYKRERVTTRPCECV